MKLWCIISLILYHAINSEGQHLNFGDMIDLAKHVIKMYDKQSDNIQEWGRFNDYGTDNYKYKKLYEGLNWDFSRNKEIKKIKHKASEFKFKCEQNYEGGRLPTVNDVVGFKELTSKAVVDAVKYVPLPATVTATDLISTSSGLTYVDNVGTVDFGKKVVPGYSVGGGAMTPIAEGEEITAYCMVPIPHKKINLPYNKIITQNANEFRKLFEKFKSSIKSFNTSHETGLRTRSTNYNDDVITLANEMQNLDITKFITRRSIRLLQSAIKYYQKYSNELNEKNMNPSIVDPDHNLKSVNKGVNMNNDDSTVNTIVQYIDELRSIDIALFITNGISILGVITMAIAYFRKLSTENDYVQGIKIIYNSKKNNKKEEDDKRTTRVRNLLMNEGKNNDEGKGDETVEFAQDTEPLRRFMQGQEIKNRKMLEYKSEFI